MRFNDHSRLDGFHAFLGASQYHWVNYTEEKLVSVYNNHLAKQRGTELHQFACDCIKLRQRLPRNHKTLNMYVNDAIGFCMTPEQILFYSDNCFGTADSISFDAEKGMLRIHDLKTGVTPAKLTQLKVYMALFCLEYQVNPVDIWAELRIYQADDILLTNTDQDELLGDDVAQLMEKIIFFDGRIEELKARA